MTPCGGCHEHGSRRLSFRALAGLEHPSLIALFCQLWLLCRGARRCAPSPGMSIARQAARSTCRAAMAGTGSHQSDAASRPSLHQDHSYETHRQYHPCHRRQQWTQARVGGGAARRRQPDHRHRTPSGIACKRRVAVTVFAPIPFRPSIHAAYGAWKRRCACATRRRVIRGGVPRAYLRRRPTPSTTHATRRWRGASTFGLDPPGQPGRVIRRKGRPSACYPRLPMLICEACHLWQGLPCLRASAEPGGIL